MAPERDRPWARACVTGRFQPLHLDHLELLLAAAARADELIVAITNPDPGTWHEAASSPHRHRPEANPFTYYERATLIRAALLDAGVPPARWSIVPFPLADPARWEHYVPRDAVQVVRAYSAWERAKAAELAAGGYRVELLDGDPAGRRTATDLRADLAGGGSAWRAEVPPATIPLLERYLAGRDIATRVTAGP